MKVLIYNPPFGKHFVRAARSAFRSVSRVQRHPDYLLYATAVLEREGHHCKFIDGAAVNLSPKAFFEETVPFMPEMAVVHTTTPSIYNDISYAEKIKTLTGAFTVLVGTHVSALPSETLGLSSYVGRRSERRVRLHTTELGSSAGEGKLFKQG